MQTRSTFTYHPTNENTYERNFETYICYKIIQEQLHSYLEITFFPSSWNSHGHLEHLQ